MIRSGDRIRDHLNDERVRNRIDSLTEHPGLRFVLSEYGSHLSATDEQITDSSDWWLDRLRETYPTLYDAIERESGGRAWFGLVMVDLTHLLREYT